MYQGTTEQPETEGWWGGQLNDTIHISLHTHDGLCYHRSTPTPMCIFSLNLPVPYQDSCGSDNGSSNSWLRHSALQKQACHWLKLWAAPMSKSRLSPALTRRRSSPASRLRSAFQSSTGAIMINSSVLCWCQEFFFFKCLVTLCNDTKDTIQLTGMLVLGSSRLIVSGQLSVNHAEH